MWLHFSYIILTSSFNLKIYVERKLAKTSKFKSPVLESVKKILGKLNDEKNSNLKTINIFCFLSLRLKIILN